MPSGNVKRSFVASGSVQRPDLDHLARCQLVDQATAGIDHVEAAVLGDPVRPKIDLVARREPKASDRRDVQAGDAWHGAMLPEATFAAAGLSPSDEIVRFRTTKSQQFAASGFSPLADHNVADVEHGALLEPEDVEGEDGFGAFDPGTPGPSSK